MYKNNSTWKWKHFHMETGSGDVNKLEKYFTLP